MGFGWLIAGVVAVWVLAIGWWRERSRITTFLNGLAEKVQRLSQLIGGRTTQKTKRAQTSIADYHQLRPTAVKDRRAMVGIGLTVMALALVVLSQTDGLLKGMTNGGEPGGIGSLSGPLFGWSTDASARITEWETWSREAGPDYADWSNVATVNVVADFVLFIPAMTLLFLAAIHALRARPMTGQGVLRSTKWLLLSLVVVDLMETSILASVIATDGSVNVLAVLLAALAKAKWVPGILLIGFLAYLRVFHVRPAPNVIDEEQSSWSIFVDDARGVRRGLVSLRVPVLVVAMTAALLLFAPILGEQMRDVIRRWTPAHASLSAVLALILAFVLWLYGSWVRDRFNGRTFRFERWAELRAGPKRTQTGYEELAADPEKRKHLQKSAWRTWKAARFAAALLIAALGLYGVIAERAGWPGRGFIVPGVFCLVLGGLGLSLDPLPAPWDRPLIPRDRTIPSAFPRFFASLIPVLLGVAVLGASLPEFLLFKAYRGSLWTLVFLVVALAAVEWVVPAVEKLRELLTDRDWVQRFWETSTGLVTLLVVSLAIWVAMGPVPDLDASLSPAWLVVIGATLIASGYVVFHLLDGLHEIRTLGQPTLRPVVSVAGETVGKPSEMSTLMNAAGLDARPAFGWILFGVPVVMLTISVLWLIHDPLGAAPRIGTTGVVLIFVLVFAVAAEFLSVFAEFTDAPKILWWAGIKRTPIFTLLLAWVIIMSFFPSPGFHDVQVVSQLTTADAPDVAARVERPVTGIGIDEVFDTWQTWEKTPGPDSEGRRRARPMFIISAWGGGIRAAVWTSLVLDCAFEGHEADAAPCRVADAEESMSRAIVAGSGISGGSLGMMEYAAYLTSEDNPSEWVGGRLGDDYLAPTISQLLFVDLPIALIGGDGRISDRGDILEAAWEESWFEEGMTEDEKDGIGLRQGLFTLWHENEDHEHPVPAFVLNGASVNDDCSLNGSILDAAATKTIGGSDDCTSLDPFTSGARQTGVLVGTRDLESFLCEGDDLYLSSASLLSARFPIISPSGRLVERDCSDPNRGPLEDGEVLYVVDGGLLELSGTLTAFQLWEALEPEVTRINAAGDDSACIVPILVHIENGFAPLGEQTTSTDAPNEWINPITSSLFTRSGLVGNARQRAGAAFADDLAGVDLVDASGTSISEQPRFIFITTTAHPGPQAPLGWSLSSTTISDLADQLGTPGNSESFELIRQWLEEPVYCETRESP